MIDSGIICKGNFEGRDVLGLRLNWHKRYITLGPVATLLGLAFKAYDPDHLVGSTEDLGITVALIPTHLPGVEIGHRHLPSMQVFQNGPNWGRDVFIPMDYIIGGQERLGQGWKMLMTALAAGRGISLPSLSAAGAAYAARTTGAYARIREQFNVPIGKFEGIEEPLARIAGTAYLLDAARRLTCAALNQGRHPAVISGIMKLQATERMRIAIDDAMDIHGGKAVIDGPQNYMGSLYRSVPVGITVEGANILTRNLIVFGQGAIRAHPYLLLEMNALSDDDHAKGLDAFDKSFWQHVGHSVTTLFRAWGRSWSGGAFAPAPDAGDATGFYRQLSRYSSAFALCADMALLTLGRRAQAQGNAVGAVRRYPLRTVSAVGGAETLAGRGPPANRFCFALEWCMASGISTIENRFAEILANMPNRFVAVHAEIPDPAVRRPRARSVRSRGTHQCAQLVLEPSAARDRLTPDLSHVEDDRGVARLEKAFLLVTGAEDIAKKMRAAHIRDAKDAVAKGVITQAEGDQLAAAHEAVSKVIEVDDFAPEALSPIYKKPAEVHQFFQGLDEKRAAS